MYKQTNSLSVALDNCCKKLAITETWDSRRGRRNATYPARNHTATQVS